MPTDEPIPQPRGGFFLHVMPALLYVAAVFYGGSSSVGPSVPAQHADKLVHALAFGGMGNVFGALLGGIILGLLESWASFFIGAGWADAVSYVVFLIVLMLRPEGLFVRSTQTA